MAARIIESFHQDSVIEGVTLGQLTASTVIRFKTSGHLLKATLFVDSNGAGTGPVTFGFTRSVIVAVQTPDNNSINVEDNKPLNLNDPVLIDEVVLTPNITGNPANWVLDFYEE